ncbi:hypothetical protein A1359_03220 [Methylomonas lenta]|uniref:Uncharacterized protein n=1 Tax=Methylomonas lenta TaxID=980561 RepID=A0A177NT77_9GAMM|nr:hypothetical protein [Methylomonas lenta]OAI20483.1 hypothetical protein A1359_03220 [Methylomonas lenta]
MNKQNKEDSKLVDSQNVDKHVDKSRRSFTRTGVIAPIIMGFASRPAWATMDNCSFGQALSGNLSQHPATCDSDTPSTVSPGVYQGDGGGKKWEFYGVGSQRTVKFKSVFGSPLLQFKSGNTWDSNKNATLEYVIKLTGNSIKIGNSTTDANAKTNHYIAAYLNALSPNLIFPFTAAQIKADWGHWTLYSTLQDIQKGELTALQANQYINFYN